VYGPPKFGEEEEDEEDEEEIIVRLTERHVIDGQLVKYIMTRKKCHGQLSRWPKE
jgi:hypothetical protein